MEAFLREQIITLIIPFLAFSIGTLAVWHKVQEWFSGREEGFRTYLDDNLWEDITPRALAIYSSISMMLGLLIGYYVFGPIAAFGIAFLFYRIPFIVVRAQIKHRHDKLEHQLEAALQNLGNSMRAGLTFIGAVKEGSKSLPEPIAEEFTIISKRYDLGKPLDEVLRDSRRRFRSPHYDLSVLAILVARRQGGNLTETLERIAEFMREVFAIDRKIRVVTAEGRLSAKIVSLAPLFMALLLWIGAPEAIVPLFTDPIGGVILFVVVILNLIGYAWIQWIVSMKF